LLGTEVVVHEDVGVAGLHRIASALPDLERADCVVVVAGMDAALASVVGGLVAAPVIGVPTSVGYGSADHGRTALNSMLSSCAAAELDERIRERSLAVLRRLAEVEGGIHGVAADDVHFHELGAADTLVDVVGTVTLLDALGVERLVCSPLPIGRGVVETAHGVL